MDLVRERLTQMKVDYESSQDRIVKFQSELQISRRNLEAAVHDKESLLRRIESVETQIINANKSREEIVDRMKFLERNTNNSEGRRRFLENRELESDQNLSNLEERLCEVRDKFFENSVKCEEGDSRLAYLRSEFERVRAKRMQSEEHSQYLQCEVDEKTLRLRDLEQAELKTSAKEFHHDDSLRLAEDHHRNALEREEGARLQVQKLQQLIDMVEGMVSTSIFINILFSTLYKFHNNFVDQKQNIFNKNHVCIIISWIFR